MSSLRKNEFEDVPLHVIHLDQDDPKKCSARRLAKHGHAILHKSTRAAPKRGFLLDPSSGILARTSPACNFLPSFRLTKALDGNE